MDTIDRICQGKLGKLTDDDFEKIAGKREHLAGKIQEAYGIRRKEADKQVWDWGKSVELTKKELG